jgi:hypothetical protein
VFCDICGAIKTVLKKTDLQQLFSTDGLKGLSAALSNIHKPRHWNRLVSLDCIRNSEGEPVRIPIEQNIWRWTWLGVAILVFTVAIVLANAVR